MKFQKKKKKNNKNKKIHKKTVDDMTPEGKSFFKSLPDSPGQMASFIITLLACYSKVHWGKEIKGKDIFLICQHVKSTVADICGISSEDLSKEMDEVEGWSLKEHMKYVEQMMDSPTDVSRMDKDPQINLENLPSIDEV